MGLTGGGGQFGENGQNCMKMTKSAFWGQNSGGGEWTWGGQANFLGSGGDPPPPTRGNDVASSYLKTGRRNITGKCI